MKKAMTLILLGGLLLSSSNSKAEQNLNQVSNKMKQEMNDHSNTNSQKHKIASFLTFQDGNAEEAMNLYVKLFDNSKIIDVQRYQKGEPGKEGRLKVARFVLNGSAFMCSDSYIKHEWDFTPAVSVFVELESEEKIKELFEKLSEEGKVMMPLDNYGFSKQFAFVQDKYGVSWQLNLEK